jgi:hypothetical protein
MGLTGGNEATAGAVDVGRLATVLLEGDATEGEPGAHVVDEHRPLLPEGEGFLDLGVVGQRVVELRRAEHVDPGHELALEVVLQVTQHVGALLLHVRRSVAQIEAHHRRRDVEFVVEVVDHRAIGVEDHALERAHAQVLQRDGVLVAHGLQVPP